jgi:hypothetical protein
MRIQGDKKSARYMCVRRRSLETIATLYCNVIGSRFAVRGSRFQSSGLPGCSVLDAAGENPNSERWNPETPTRNPGTRNPEPMV